MKTTLTQLTPIPAEYIVGHALTKKTEIQRRPYVELIRKWSEHEGQEEAGLMAIRRISGQQLVDPDHMPKELYEAYREPEKAKELIKIVQTINEKMQNGDVRWTWAHVMRVMVDEKILLADISFNCFDRVICSMIPGKGRDTVRKSGRYEDIMRDRSTTYNMLVSNSNVNPEAASTHEVCSQIAQLFAPIISRKASITL